MRDTEILVICKQGAKVKIPPKLKIPENAAKL
jgi:hypothetical protein